jgi:deoxyribodipyrimidine photolyase-like uncharacterized protein
MLPPRGFVTAPDDFTGWAQGRRGLLLEDFYRHARRRHDILMDGAEPAGGAWNLDAENRDRRRAARPGLGVPEPPAIREDEIDAGVRADLDRWAREDGIRFVGTDGPRLLPATRTEARTGCGTSSRIAAGVRPGAPHPAADGARQLRDAARLASGRDVGLVPPLLRGR